MLLGTVRKITPVVGQASQHDLAVAVDEYLKGAGPAVLTVRDYSYLAGDACSAFSPDAVDEGYLLFLGRDDAGPLTTSFCSGSTVINDRTREHVDDVIAQVRQIVSGEAPTPVAEATPTTVPTPGGLPAGGIEEFAERDGGALVWTLVLGGAAALVAGGGLWFRLRR